MFGSVKQIFVSAMMFFGCNLLSINSNEPSFYPYSVKINKYSGSCNNINNPSAKNVCF